MIEEWKKYVELADGGAPLIEGLGDWACLHVHIPDTVVHIAVGDYLTTVSAYCKRIAHPMTKEQKEALDGIIEQAKMEAGRLAAERLTALIK